MIIANQIWGLFPVSDLLNHERFHRIFLIFLCLAFGAALASYALIGSHMRYSGDDYCFGALLRNQGFWKASWGPYFGITSFPGNRYSMILLSMISGLFPPKFNGLLPGLAILLWLIGLSMALREVFYTLGTRLPDLYFLSIAEVLIFLTLYQAPDLSQSLYWRSGMFTYLAPLILFTWLVVVVLRQSKKPNASPVALGFMSLLAVFSGGFSETSTALQLGFFLIFLVVVLVRNRSHLSDQRPLILVLSITVIASFIALVFLYISPANQVRRIDMALPSPPDLYSLIRMSFTHSMDFIVGTIKALRTPSIYTLIIAFFLSVALNLRFQLPGFSRFSHLLIGVLLIPLAAYLLIVCCMAPSAYVQHAYPESRALILARVVMVCAIMCLGWIAAQVLTKKYGLSFKYKSVLVVCTLFVLSAMCLYPLRAADVVIKDLPHYQKWSQFWDARDREIRDAKESGVQDIEVVQIDHIIPRVGELSPDPGFWYNGCAAEYYGVDSISASLSGWDD